MTATYDTVADNRRGVPRWCALLAQVPLSLHQLLFRVGVASVFLKAGLICSWMAPPGA
jgi:hypothetical protein